MDDGVFAKALFPRAWHPFEEAWQRPPADGRMRVHPGDADYERQAAAEAAFWANPRGFSIEGLEGVLSVFDRHTNLRFTGDPGVAWHQTLQRYSQFKRGIALGAGGRLQMRQVLELNPGLHLTLCDIAGDSLADRRAQLEPLFPGRIDVRTADLNFAELEADTYDVVISAGTLHHVINIEHVADQIARALQPGGYLFVQDYAAETRFAWRQEKRARYEEIVQWSSVQRTGSPCRISWRDMRLDECSPFEAIRSEDTIDVLRERLPIVSMVGAGALSALLLFTQVEQPPRRINAPYVRWKAGGVLQRVRSLWDADARTVIDRRFLEAIFALEDQLTDAGRMLPYNAFAVFRKPG